MMSTSRGAQIAGQRARNWSSFHQVLAQRPEVEVSAALLAEARMGLDEALESQQHGWRALWHNGLPILRFQPASGFALALTLGPVRVWPGMGIAAARRAADLRRAGSE